MVQILGNSNIKSASGSCGNKGPYEGEVCLIPATGSGDNQKVGKFPVTEGGKISPGRIRNVAVRASQFGYKDQVISGGLCNWAKKAGIKSSLCGGDKK